MSEIIPEIADVSATVSPTRVNNTPYIHGLTAYWDSDYVIKLNHGACSDYENNMDLIIPDYVEDTNPESPTYGMLINNIVTLDARLNGIGGVDASGTGIANLTAANAGTGYTQGDMLTVAGGIGGTLEVRSITVGGVISKVIIRNPGTAYTAGTHALEGGTGANATITITVGNLAQVHPYYVYVIGSSFDSMTYPTAAILSASMTKPLMPFGYDSYRLVDIKQTGVTNPVKFVPSFTDGNAEDRVFYYISPVNVLGLGQGMAGGGDATTYTDVELTGVVSGLSNPVAIKFTAFLDGASGGGAGALNLQSKHGSNDYVNFVIDGAAKWSQEVEAFGTVDADGSVDVEYKVTTGAKAELWVKSYSYSV